MLKKLVISGLAGSAALLTFGAAPAHAGGEDEYDDHHKGGGNVQIIGIQTCRGIDIAGVGAAIHNILGMTYESGDCINGSVVDD
ncbi:hypothetical protein [Actinomadura rudentiformis]|uniref:DUF320 domain-containing protein n=1 Tax=Actinomadura rudentiformis TaxID=359158 RepID=A0A6H9Z864_9ACTN|nr:hypothetical protein [Actinomadura rudentiformis]KAB2350116.1 hypothetical protein F8566_09930 [Actinomadura rudentiformis]